MSSYNLTMQKVTVLVIAIVLSLTFFSLTSVYCETLNTMPLLKVEKLFHENGNKLPPQLEIEPQSHLKHVGQQRILVLLCYFKDLGHYYQRSFVTNKFDSSKERSLKNFYEISSYGKLTIDYGPNPIHDWMAMPRLMSEYNMGNYETLYYDAIKTAKENGIDISYYDENGDEMPDLTTIVWGGDSWTMGGPVPGDFMFRTGGGTCIMVGEDHRFDFPLITIMHETFHALGGLWDLYDYAGVQMNVGGWDLMGEGVWYKYCGLSSFSRWKAEWLEIETITEPGIYEVDDLNGDGLHKAYHVPIPDSNEWILIENRQRHGGDGYFRGCPTSGLVMYHVDNNRPYDHGFNSLFPPFKTAGIKVIDSGGSSAYKEEAYYGYNVGRTKIGPETTPSTLPYNLKASTTRFVEISEISTIGPKMTFKLSYQEPKLPVLSVLETVSIGKIPKGDKGSGNIKFRNVAYGTIRLLLKPTESWIKLDRSSFLGNDETINIEVDTTSLQYGVNTGFIEYKGNPTNGKIAVVVDVTSIPGDANLDGTVDNEDYIIFIQNYGLDGDNPKFNKNTDFNRDGIIDNLDLFLLARNLKTSL